MTKARNSWEVSSRTGRICRRLDDADQLIEPLAKWKNRKSRTIVQTSTLGLDEECHIEGETEFEAAVAECCDSRSIVIGRVSPRIS